MLIIAGSGLQVGVIVQANFAGANAQQAEQDPEHQQRNVKQHAVQQALNNVHCDHRHRRHQQRAEKRKVLHATEQDFESMIELPVLAQLKQAFGDENQQRRKQRHGISLSDEAVSRPRNFAQSNAGPGSVLRTGAISLWPVMFSAMAGYSAVSSRVTAASC